MKHIRPTTKKLPAKAATTLVDPYREKKNALLGPVS